jgi:hypothetical protein
MTNATQVRLTTGSRTGAGLLQAGSACRHLGYWLLALPLVMIAGFWIPYLSGFPQFDAHITPAVHVHAVLLFCWVALLVVQPLAIRYRAFATHRLLGRISYVLMPLIVLFATAMIRKEYREEIGGGMPVAAAVAAQYLACGQLGLLGAVYGLSIRSILRGDVARHLRYMVCTAIILLPAGLARILGYWFDVRQSNAQAACLAVIDLVLLGLVAHDRRRGLPAHPYVATFAAYIVIEAGWFALGRPV